MKKLGIFFTVLVGLNLSLSALADEPSTDCYPGLLTLLLKGGETGDDFELGHGDTFFPGSFLVASRLDSIPPSVTFEPVLQDTVRGFNPSHKTPTHSGMKLSQVNKKGERSESVLRGNSLHRWVKGGGQQLESYSVERKGFEKGDAIYGDFSYIYFQAGLRNFEKQSAEDFKKDILKTEDDIATYLGFAVNPDLLFSIHRALSKLNLDGYDKGIILNQGLEIAQFDDMKEFLKGLNTNSILESQNSISRISEEALEEFVLALFPHVKGQVHFEYSASEPEKEIKFLLQGLDHQVIKFNLDQSKNLFEITLSSTTPSGVATEMKLKFENPDFEKIKSNFEKYEDFDLEQETLSKSFLNLLAKDGGMDLDSNTFYVGLGHSVQGNGEHHFISFTTPRRLPKFYKQGPRVWEADRYEQAQGFDVKMAIEFAEKGFEYDGTERSYLDSKIIFKDGRVGYVFRFNSVEENPQHPLYGQMIPLYRVFLPVGPNLN